MLNRLHLRGVGPAPELELEFASRLNLLTGDNGLGKSFVLDIAWWALTDTWAGRAAWPREETSEDVKIESEILGLEPAPSATEDDRFTVYTTESFYEFGSGRWRHESRHWPIPSLVLYARVDGSFSVWDSSRNHPGKPWAEELGRVAPVEAFHFSPTTLWEGLADNGRVLCEGLIRDWVSWQRQRTKAFDLLVEILKILSPSPEEELRPGEPLRLSVEDVRDHPTLEMPYGTVPLVFASAGIKRIVGLAYLLVWAWQEHLEAAKILRRTPAARAVFLVDELDAHLHPRWQRSILPAVLKAAGGLQPPVDVQLLATTHAPLVLASAEPLFDESKDALFTFDLVGRDVAVSKAHWHDQGDASAWLTSEVFDLGEARSVPAEKAIQEAKAAMRNPSLLIEEKRRIHNDLRKVLKDTDPFWARWLVQAKAAGIEP